MFRFGFGKSPFLSNNCPVTNCYVTADRTLFPSLSHFDAILFHARDMDKRIIQVTQSSVFLVMTLVLVRSRARRGGRRIRFMCSFSWNLL